MKKLMMLMAALILSFGMMTGCGEGDTPKDNQSNTTADTSKDQSTDQTEKNDSANDTADNDNSDDSNDESDDKLLSGTHHVEINVKKYGTISVELDADTAPISVTNFINLAEAGFYDGLTFHRIITGFMIQGGDPTGTGMGGSEETIKGEFSANGVENDISHTRGVISMARSNDPDSASSQFFIVHEDSPHLDGDYAAFGHVTEGMEIVDQICEDTPVEDQNGTVLAENQPTIKSIKVID